MRIQKIIINCQKKYKFKEINKLTIKVQGDISDLNLCYYLKLPLPMSAKERTFYEKLAYNKEYIDEYCYGNHDRFSDKCIRWFLYNKSKISNENEDLCFDYDANVEKIQ